MLLVGETIVYLVGKISFLTRFIWKGSFSFAVFVEPRAGLLRANKVWFKIKAVFRKF